MDIPKKYKGTVDARIIEDYSSTPSQYYIQINIVHGQEWPALLSSRTVRCFNGVNFEFTEKLEKFVDDLSKRKLSLSDLESYIFD